jgi:L-fuculose-phosphate aldolase
MGSLDIKLMHPRDQIVLIISRIYRKGMTTTSGGNVSIIDDQGDIWITPSGIDKGSLRAEDINCIKADGTILGKHKPSSEFPFHRAIYKSRPELKAIIHAHPPALVSFSIAHIIPDTNIVPQAKYICGPIGYADYDVPGSEELGIKIADVFRDGYNAVIMENHGTVVGGTDMKDTYQRFETLEFCARTIIYGKTIGKVKSLTDAQIDTFEAQIPTLQPEIEAVSYPSDEREKREEIIRIVRRACDQGLMISTYGTVSVRWRDNDFLITPTNVLRWDITLDDIVQIKGSKREPGKLPSRAVWLHQEIYRHNPHINSIIITQSPYLMAFSVTGNKFNVRTIPESWVFLQDVPNVPFGLQFTGEDTIPRMISKDTPAIIVENDAVIVTGDKLLQTFDRLEVAEFSAKSLVLGSVMGELKPIGDKEVEDLRKKFLS